MPQLLLCCTAGYLRILRLTLGENQESRPHWNGWCNCRKYETVACNWESHQRRSVSHKDRPALSPSPPQSPKLVPAISFSERCMQLSSACFSPFICKLKCPKSFDSTQDSPSWGSVPVYYVYSRDIVSILPIDGVTEQRPEIHARTIRVTGSRSWLHFLSDLTSGILFSSLCQPQKWNISSNTNTHIQAPSWKNKKAYLQIKAVHWRCGFDPFLRRWDWAWLSWTSQSFWA